MKKLLYCLPVILIMMFTACSGDKTTAANPTTNVPETNTTSSNSTDNSKTGVVSDISTGSTTLSEESNESTNEDMVSVDLNLAFDTSSLEELTPGYSYMYDGMVYYSLDKLLPTDYSADAILSQLQTIMDTEIRVTNITESDEYSALFSYPAWLIVYEVGENEDTRECFDIYFQTDTYDYWAHSAVPLDFSTEYHDIIFNQFSTYT
jgi:hypothetical protein